MVKGQLVPLQVHVNMLPEVINGLKRRKSYCVLCLKPPPSAHSILHSSRVPREVCMKNNIIIAFLADNALI